MPWPVHPNGLLGAQGDNDTYRIERSLRFNSADSAYLSRTPSSAGNRTTWTLSFWIKKCSTNLSFESIFNSTPAGSGDTIRFDGNNKITFVTTIAGGNFTSDAVFRDTSSWYHFVVTLNTNNTTQADRLIFYVNGTRLTGSSITISSGSQGSINNNASHEIGVGNSSSYYLNSYLTEINFIDGQALTPSSFGETDAITGRWKAKSYGGTYGTNGFYLKFADNSGTTATTLGKDSSGNGNNWTPNNFSVTAGAGNDSLVDSPTNYGTDTGVGGEVRGNYATYSILSPVVAGGGSALATLANGNLDASSASASFFDCFSTFNVPSSGKWYLEWTITAVGTNHYLGIGSRTSWSSASKLYQNSGSKVVNGTTSSYGLSYTTSDVIGMALDMDVGTMTMYKNNSSQGVLASDLISAMPSGGWAIIAEIRGTASHSTNFGQRPFAYTAPTGFKALCTTNLPTPTIKKPSSYMDVVTYTGNGSARSITGFGFSPDLVWIKQRSSIEPHILSDSVRGSTNALFSNTTGSEVANEGPTSFNFNGFSLGAGWYVNRDTYTYVAWAWDEAPIAGMDIVSYTGNGTNRTIAHNLGVAPAMMIVKRRDNVGAWFVYHQSQGATKYMTIDTAAAATSAAAWNNTAPSSSVFTVGTDNNVNGTSGTYIAYLFAEVEGFSKFGSYTGNGSADGPFVWCGFRPRWVLTKNISSGAAGYDWMIWDTSRDSFNEATKVLSPDLSNAEYSTSIDALSNGFKMRNSGATANANGSTHIFAAFAEFPFKYARAR